MRSVVGFTVAEMVKNRPGRGMAADWNSVGFPTEAAVGEMVRA